MTEIERDFEKEYFELKEERIELELEEFYTEDNILVTCRYAKEIAAYWCIKFDVIQEARKINKGKKNTYPFLYRTNAKLLMKEFCISYEAATKIIKFLNATGAWKLIKTEQGKTYVYQIGTRKNIYHLENGKRVYEYIDRFYFDLSRNEKLADFYKSKIKRIKNNKRRE